MDERTDAAARRAYWTEQLDAAYAFMQRVRQQPAKECGEPLVSLAEAAQAAGVALEFSSKPHVLGLPRLYFLRAGLIDPLLAAARDMWARGWVMRIEDGFRTRAMQRQLALQPYTFDIILKRVLWELDGQPLTPEFMQRRLSVLVANAPQFGTHMSGSAVDISVLDRASGVEVERGGAYLEMSELTPLDSPFVSRAAHDHRVAITALMEGHGFVAYPWEFWHYNSGDAYAAVLRGRDQPARFGPVDVDLTTGSVQPIHSALQELNSVADIEKMLALARQRAASAVTETQARNHGQ
jgi:D-alanyl-D-alanine dipeptidase